MDESIIIILVVSAVFAVVIFAWMARQPLFRVSVTPMSVTVMHYDAVEISLTLECKPGFGLKWAAVPATFILQRGAGGRVGVSKTLGASASDGSGFSLQLIGLQPGDDTFRVSATPAGRTLAVTATIPVIVTEDSRGTRRIRHTAVALSDPAV